MVQQKSVQKKSKKVIAKKAKIKRSKFQYIDDVIVITFALASVFLLFLELSGSVESNQSGLIRSIDLVIALFFFGEFFVRLYFHKNRKRFLIFHWWELLAAIPIASIGSQLFRSLRLLRVFEVVQVARATARLETTGGVFSEYSDHPYLIEAISTLLAIMFIAAVLFYRLENGVNPNIHSIWDAFWWASTTLTTTGYGDISPVTSAGRVVAIILMFTGVISVALLTGVVVQYVSTRKKSRK
ncbi:MAG: potassium channel family protein [Candidatus Saccharibacteria bacterium]